jgi:hypothetical protein
MVLPDCVYAMAEHHWCSPGAVPQVARNAQGAEAVTDAEQAQAEAAALSALSDALAGVGTDSILAMSTASSAVLGHPQRLARTSSLSAATGGDSAAGGAQGSEGNPYTVIVRGDDLRAAAAGLTTGYVHLANSAKTTAVRKPSADRSQSPTSPLDGPEAFPEGSEEALGGSLVPGADDGDSAGAQAAEGDGGGGGGDESGAPPPAAGVGLPLFTPGGSLDVDAVEAHMVSLLQVPGAARSCLPEVPTLDEQARSLRATALKVGR